MPTTTYTTIDGQIVSENRAGTQKFYGPDPLGSVVTIYDTTGTVTDTFTYWPYGEIRTSTGSTATPFKFCGTWGYYSDATGRLYVRARFYRDKIARWQTVDPLWPEENAWGYCGTSPVVYTDRTGLQFGNCDDPPRSDLLKALKALQDRMAKVCDGDDRQGRVGSCFALCGDSSPETEGKCYCKHIHGKDPNFDVDIDCHDNGSQDCWQHGKAVCMYAKRGGKGGACVIRICPQHCPQDMKWEEALLHEFMHCCGASHDSRNRDCQADPSCLERCLRAISGIRPSRQPDWTGILDMYNAGG